MHDYYYYTKEELLKNPKIPLIVMEDNAKVFRSMAEEMVEEIERKNALGEKTVFICPVGPVGQYPYFVDMVNEKNVDFSGMYPTLSGSGNTLCSSGITSSGFIFV